MSIDELMWEQEVAEHMARTAWVVDDLPTVDRPPRATAASRRAGGDVIAVVLLAVVMVLVFTTGWSIGWYLV